MTAPRSVPEAILCFLDGANFEHAVRLAVSPGGDTDTMACIPGALAHAYRGEVPVRIAYEVRRRLSPDLLVVLDAFTNCHPVRNGSR